HRRTISADAKALCHQGGARAGRPAAPHLPEVLFKNTLKPPKAAAVPSPRRAGKPLRTKTEVFKIRVGVKTAIASSRPGACAETFEAAETGFALSVDLAAIEGFALVLVAEQLMCGFQLGETACCFGIVLRSIGMQSS